MIDHQFNYLDYKGSAKYSSTDHLWHGKILDIEDCVTYEASTAVDLQEEFCIAVDDWIETRKSIVTTEQKE